MELDRIKDAFSAFWRIISDDTYYNLVRKVSSVDSFGIEHLGNELEGNIVYKIDVELPYSGWFSMMNDVISGLLVADKYGFIPCVSLGDNHLYKDKALAGKELFEYYYEKISVEGNERSSNITYMTPEQSYIAGANRVFDQTNKVVCELADVIRKYLHFNPEMKKYLESCSSVKLLKNNRVLGVHVRGTDFKAKFDGHTKYVAPEEFLSKAIEQFSKYNFDYIFLATDELETVDLFGSFFGGQLICNDVFRGTKASTVGIHCQRSSREYHNYKLGQEAIQDMICLSLCETLIACPSGIPYHAMLNKLSRGEEYNDIIIIDKGTYKSNRISYNEIEKILKRRY